MKMKKKMKRMKAAVDRDDNFLISNLAMCLILASLCLDNIKANNKSDRLQRRRPAGSSGRYKSVRHVDTTGIPKNYGNGCVMKSALKGSQPTD